MHVFLRIYGRTALSLAATVLLSTGLAVFLGRGFGQYGTVPDRSVAVREMAGQKKSMAEHKPVLDVKSIRLIQGEKRTVESMASARDIDGRELGDSICFTDGDGHMLNGFFDTSTPGCFPVTVSVCSKISGEKIQKTVYILVDGRVNAWKG